MVVQGQPQSNAYLLKREEGWKGKLRAMWVQRREEADAGGSQGYEGQLHGEDV